MLYKILHHTSVSQPYPLFLLQHNLFPFSSLAFIPSTGCPGRRPHHQLPAGEVPSGPPEPRGEELPYFLSANRGRRGGPAETPGPGEKPSAVPVPGQSKTTLILCICDICYCIFLIHLNRCLSVILWTKSLKANFTVISSSLHYKY